MIDDCSGGLFLSMLSSLPDSILCCYVSVYAVAVAAMAMVIFDGDRTDDSQQGEGQLAKESGDSDERWDLQFHAVTKLIASLRRQLQGCLEEYIKHPNL